MEKYQSSSSFNKKNNEELQQIPMENNNIKNHISSSSERTFGLSH